MAPDRSLPNFQNSQNEYGQGSSKRRTGSGGGRGRKKRGGRGGGGGGEAGGGARNSRQYSTQATQSLRNKQSKGRGRDGGRGNNSNQLMTRYFSSYEQERFKCDPENMIQWWDQSWRAKKLQDMKMGAGTQSVNAKYRVNKGGELAKAMMKKMELNELDEIAHEGKYTDEQKKDIEDTVKEAEMFCQFYKVTNKKLVLVISPKPLPRFHPKYGQTRQVQWTVQEETVKNVEQMLLQLEATGLMEYVSERLKGYEWWQERNNFEMDPFDQHAIVEEGDADEEHQNEMNEFEEQPYIITEQSKRIQRYEEQRKNTPEALEMMKRRQELPAWSFKDEIAEAVLKNQVVLISGATGCGKTTQVPQFVLEQQIQAGRGSDTFMFCTQPRRISAISVAERVAAERGEDIGSTVGYQIRLEDQQSGRTKLLFCTTGVLLRKLQNDACLKGVSHVVIDEIHERNKNEDFLLILLKDVLPKRPDLRVILMSATLNAQDFQNYLGGGTQCPQIEIPGRTFPVEVNYLEDILDKTGIQLQSAEVIQAKDKKFRPKPISKDGFSGYDFFTKPPAFELNMKNILSEQTQENLKHWTMTRWPTEQWLPFLYDLLVYIQNNEGPGAVLVFLPGWSDITMAYNRLTDMGEISGAKIIPLHGSMPTSNQREVFEVPTDGTRKIILATNIAETSITINDVVFVVNLGLTKETTYDPQGKIVQLKAVWASKASFAQRAGRAGRVQSGKCYHLVPKQFHDEMLGAYQLPELQRTPLEEICLQVKVLRGGKIAPFLEKAMNPPDSLSVAGAIENLKNIGALDLEERLLPLGYHLSSLPCDPSLGKLLILGAIFKVLKPVLTIVVALAERDPFISPIDQQQEADEAKRRFAGDSASDHIAIVRAMDGFEECQRRDGMSEGSYCYSNFLSKTKLIRMREMRIQFVEYLVKMGFVKRGDYRRGDRWFKNKRALIELMEDYSVNYLPHDMELFRAVLAGGLYPNYAILENKVVPAKKQGKQQKSQKPGAPKAITSEDGKVMIYQGSVLKGKTIEELNGEFLVYSLKMRLGTILLMASSRVSLQSLLLFGECQLSEQNKGQVFFKDCYINVSPYQARVLLETREHLHKLLQFSYEHPSFNFLNEGHSLVSAVREYLGEPPELLKEMEEKNKVESQWLEKQSQIKSIQSGGFDEYDVYDDDDDDDSDEDDGSQQMLQNLGASMSWYDGSPEYSQRR